jgi:ribonuclease BN (tRNA processing enzyme)
MTFHRLPLAGLRIVSLLLLFGLAAGAGAQQPPARTDTPPPLSLVVLGSGGPGATGRAGSSYLVLVDGKPRILVDAGPGSFVRLGEAKLPLANVDTVLLTHLHVDHVGELPGLFKARAVSTGGRIAFKVFGPGAARGHGDAAPFPSTRRFVELLFGRAGAFGYLRDFSAPMTVQATDVAGAPGVVRTLLSEDGVVVSAIAGHHRDAPAVIYRIDHAGKSITFSGDIDPGGHAALRRIAQGTDLLVFNSVVLDPPGSSPVLYTLHTPPKQIGEIAGTVRAGALLLSHLSPSVERAREEVAASIAEGYAGTVVFAHDGARIEP